MQAGGAAPAVDAIVRSHVAARGGAEAWNAVTSLVRSQSNQFVTIETTWVRAAAGRPDRARVDQSVADYAREARVFDGETGWLAGPSGLRQLSASDVQELREDAAGMVELLAAKDLNLTIALAAADSLEGKPVWKLAVTFQSGRKLTLWLDASTWLEVGRARSVTAPDGSSTEIWTGLGEYRKVNGIEMPHAVNDAAAAYKINTPIPDAHFKR